MRSLPPPPQSFVQKKGKILEQLSIPDSEYTDASPKGSVDAGIRDLIDALNGLDGFVTTSSCAGRVSVFVEGRKAAGPTGQHNESTETNQEEEARAVTIAGIGGKGGGGNWLFVSHDPVAVAEGKDLEEVFGLKTNGKEASDRSTDSQDVARLIHFKFEPMILHVLTASLEHAQLLLRCGLQAGFRESGALNLVSSGGEAITPMVAIRTMGLGLESLIGIQKGGAIQRTVSAEYLQTLLDISNDRFTENTKRIERFRAAILEAVQPPKKKDGTDWEDAAARRERKKAEGLQKKAEMEAARDQSRIPDQADPLDMSLNTDLT
ncbi:putative Methyltransferase TYW3-domain-containing protein [Seiridium unicorne]|uniref:tRNA(Phe) 7-[(3-amino-3-carboxypropyl)-4-demethylwyosine(37)-N(4)]-methyltransferase n=1 Tax=Seiridium unicorne TaxID=138068 RepID=A0ABR2USW2_9PEZI